MTPDAQLAILQALIEDAFNNVMAKHGTILTNNFAEIVGKDLPALAEQISNSFGEMATARENGMSESDLRFLVENLATFFEDRFQGVTAKKIREIGEEALLRPHGDH